MGIRGLTTYIANNSHQYLQDFELHNSYLVIDGCSISAQLSNYNMKCHCMFGGDYDQYAQIVSNFFDKLLKCNITPLVLYDGAIENKKLKTVIRRVKEKIKLVSCVNLSCHKHVLPLLQQNTFRDIVVEKNIRHARCTYEADNVIAAIAKALNCPVLSYDSDFYIYGALYIPFNTMNSNIYKNQTTNHYIQRCKIYKVENLLNSFHGLNQSMLPLAAILLGNDYVKRNIFRNFHNHIKLPRPGKGKCNKEQQRIEAIFNWLRRYNLNNAITMILSRLPKTSRKDVLEVIEFIINSYNNGSINMLLLLGFSTEYVTELKTKNKYKAYKFEGNINNLEYIEEISNTDELELSEEEENENEQLVDIMQESDEQFYFSHLPHWFLHEFNMAHFSSYFLNMLTRKLYVLPVQIEDHLYPTTAITSVKIINVIYCLLTSGIKVHPNYMYYIIRSNNKRIARHRLERTDTLFSENLPSLFDLKDVDLITKRNIVNNTLGVTLEDMNKFPQEWSLYIATVIYWIRQEQKPLKTGCHIYSILFAMLYNVIDRKIGYYRNIRSFQIKYDKELKTIPREHKDKQCELQYPRFKSIEETLDQVTVNDCLQAAPFFISHFFIDHQLSTNPKKFNMTIVHTFNELQMCLKHINDLNALLGYPYQPIKAADVFNGTLLYNLYTNFEKRSDVRTYVKIVLHNCQSLLHLFNELLSKITPLFTTLLETKIHYKRKKKSKPNIKESDIEDDFEQSDMVAIDYETSFYDHNNRFSVLNRKN